jgi:hypothetical protein
LDNVEVTNCLVVSPPHFRFLLFNLHEAGWQTLRNTRTISPKNGVGFDYSTSAVEITWEITCTASCNVYLLNVYNLNRLKQGVGFDYFYAKVGTTISTASYAYVNDIKNTVIIYVVNPSNSTSLTANFLQAQNVFIPSSQNLSWLTWVFLSVFGLIICCCCFIGISSSS